VFVAAKADSADPTATCGCTIAKKRLVIAGLGRGSQLVTLGQPRFPDLVWGGDLDLILFCGEWCGLWYGDGDLDRRLGLGEKRREDLRGL